MKVFWSAIYILGLSGLLGMNQYLVWKNDSHRAKALSARASSSAPVAIVSAVRQNQPIECWLSGGEIESLIRDNCNRDREGAPTEVTCRATYVWCEPLEDSSLLWASQDPGCKPAPGCELSCGEPGCEPVAGCTC